jgi:hypothetical protein
LALKVEKLYLLVPATAECLSMTRRESKIIAWDAETSSA